MSAGEAVLPAGEAVLPAGEAVLSAGEAELPAGEAVLSDAQGRRLKRREDTGEILNFHRQSDANDCSM